LPPISLCKPPQHRQHAFTTSIDLCEFNQQRARMQPDLSEYFRRASRKYDWTDRCQGRDVLVGESKHFVHRQAFDQYPRSSIWLLHVDPLSSQYTLMPVDI
jgi:hypothetical protein